MQEGRGFRIAMHHIARLRGQLYFRLRRVRFRLRRLAFAATFLRYCSTILSRDAPAIRLVPAFAAASIFSLTMRWASRWGLCRRASTWLCAVRSRDCFLAPASSSSTCCDIPSKATSFRIASATTVCAVSNQSRVAVTKGTICSLVPLLSLPWQHASLNCKGSFTLI